MGEQEGKPRGGGWGEKGGVGKRKKEIKREQREKERESERGCREKRV